MVCDKILPMQRSKEIVSVSTDIAGLLGKPKDVIEAYSDCRRIVDFGFEVICWRGINVNYFDKVRNLGIQVNGLHGPVSATNELYSGSWTNNIKGRIVDGLMVGAERLPELSKASQADYILIHQRLVDSPEGVSYVEGISHGFCQDTVLMIENVSNSGSIEKTVTAVEQLSERGVRVGLMVDLVHLLKDLANSGDNISVFETDRHWGEVLSVVGDVAGRVEILGFHIPVGLNQSDSLPVEAMNRRLWIEFAELLAECPKVRFKTIENQRPNTRTPFLISRQEMKMLKERNYRLLSQLKEAGVI